MLACALLGGKEKRLFLAAKFRQILPLRNTSLLPHSHKVITLTLNDLFKLVYVTTE